ncbi:3-isopropylmalate dehydratase small subunit [Qipengyuania sp. MTN3-11]|uniref:3-isopropylmalate dehydratase small subunit n=1 Tax=Qipengyuania sp. MTN3-11 TaxID=3056557 RepID=UPI0036F42F50
MRLEPFNRLESRTLVLPQANIDTDQIIPARFLTTTDRAGLGQCAFYDWRYTADDQPKNATPFPVVGAGDRQVLVAGANFGCGSSREHAPWALLDYGFRVVISTQIADIFKSNALKNGLLPVEIDAHTHALLLANPGIRVGIDLEDCTVVLDDGSRASFSVEPFARRCLLDGVDPLGHILAHESRIAAFEAAAA